MRALLLAAGFGQRLRPVTDQLPKCLVPIMGQPLLGHWFDLLGKGGIERILVNLHHLPDKVREFVQSCAHASMVESVYEETLLGTGGTILKNSDFFCEQPFMVIHADNLSLFNVSDFKASHERRPTHTEITMMTFSAPDPKLCGIVEVDSEGVVRTFCEKAENPPGNLANAAVYILEPSIIKFLAALKKDVIDLSTEVIPAYLGRINTFHNGLYHRDIGTNDSLVAAQREYPAVARAFMSRQM